LLPKNVKQERDDNVKARAGTLPKSTAFETPETLASAI
jgi:hypothetical protein